VQQNLTGSPNPNPLEVLEGHNGNSSARSFGSDENGGGMSEVDGVGLGWRMGRDGYN
jgi:hypothetical protein